MPGSLLRRVALCLVIAAPAIVLRLTGVEAHPVVELLVFGGSVVAASFLLAWAAEAARKDISGTLAIALLALIAVLPECIVDVYYAFRSGSDPAFAQYTAANMTGSNRLLLGFGWPLVVLIGLTVARRGRPTGERPSALRLPAGSRLGIAFLAVLGVAGLVMSALGQIPIWFGAVLVAVFAAYLWSAGRVCSAGDEEEFVGAAALIANLPTMPRRATVIALFAAAGGIILSAAEPFANSLVEAGAAVGMDSYMLVQWLAPLASEAPEFIVAVVFALRGRPTAALMTLIAAKINQWTLLVGSLPIAHFLGGGGAGITLDARQVGEFGYTASLVLVGVGIIVGLRFHALAAIGLFGVFALQFVVTDTGGRTLLGLVQLALAAVLLIIHRRDLPAVLRAPFGHPASAPAEGDTGRVKQAVAGDG